MLNCPPDDVVINVSVSLTNSFIVSPPTPEPPEINLTEIAWLRPDASSARKLRFVEETTVNVKPKTLIICFST